MNVIDYGIIGVIALCVLFGFYRGFIQSLLNLGGCLLSFAGSFWLFPKLSDALSANTGIVRMISSYTDSGSILGDLDLSSQAVTTLSASNINAIVAKANLPEPIGKLLQANLTEKVFSPLGNLATSVGDYVNQTILSVSINVLCFILCFLACFIIITVLINLVKSVFRFPVLKQLDWLAGGAFGFLVGCVLCFIVFTAMPLLQSVIPISQFQDLINQSTLAKVFENGNLIVSIMNRKL
ncbi:MAG TPA: CvpA family protein [Candidatus Limiplasma sp.]|nr:CvpA family protein [Candidatus Limiplasma sp.]HPS80479.1 CvpA family protein [Candidatus Limiplasma sp.]